MFSSSEIFFIFSLPFLLLFRFPVPLALAPSSISLSSQGVSLLFTDWWYCDRDLTGIQNVSPLLWEPQGHRPICPCTMLNSLRVEAAEAGGGNVAKQMQQNQADCLGGSTEKWRKEECRERHLEAGTLDARASGPPDEQHHLQKKLSPCSWPDESESLAQHEPCVIPMCQLCRF